MERPFATIDLRKSIEKGNKKKVDRALESDFASHRQKSQSIAAPEPATYREKKKSKKDIKHELKE